MRLVQTVVLTLLLLSSTTVFGQVGYIRGTITDGEGFYIEGVTVSIRDGRPVESDITGAYVLGVPSGKVHQVTYTRVGYRLETRRLGPINAGDTLMADLALQEAATFDSVLVTSSRRRNNVEILKPSDYFAIPTTADGIKTILQTLPSVSSNNELSGQYSVRGGNFDENLVYVNGIEVLRPLLARSGQQEGLSIVNVDLIEGLEFSAGGFEARFGDKMSSVLDIRYKEPDSFRMKFSAGLLGVSGHLETASPNRRLTLLIGSRYRTNRFLLASLDVQAEYLPVFFDVQSYLTYDITDRLQLGYLSYYGSNRYLTFPLSQRTAFGSAQAAFQFDATMGGREELRNNVLLQGLTLSWRQNAYNNYDLIGSYYSSTEVENFDVLSAYTLGQLDTDRSSDNYGDVSYIFGVGAFLNHGRNKLDVTVGSMELKGRHTHQQKEQIDLQWGIKGQSETIADRLYEYRYIDSADYSWPQGNPNSLDAFEFIEARNSQTWARFNGYLQNTFTVSSEHNSFLNLGLRANHWTYNGQTLISPRFQFSFDPNAPYNRALARENAADSLYRKSIRLQLSGGAYHQPPFYRELRDLYGNLNAEIRAQRSYHIVGGADMTVRIWDRPFKWSTEAYYKLLRDLVPYEQDNVRIRYYARNNAKGYATGLEMMMTGEFVKDIPSWVSVAYMKTSEDLSDDSYMRVGEGGDTSTIFPGFIPRPTDQRLRFSLFFQDFLPRNPTYKVHLSLIFGSGLPFGPPDYTRHGDTFRMPIYRRVDVGFSKLVYGESVRPRPWLKGIESIWLSAELFNIFGINNTVSYLWIQDVIGRQWGIPAHLTGRRLNLHLEVTL